VGGWVVGWGFFLGIAEERPRIWVRYQLDLKRDYDSYEYWIRAGATEPAMGPLLPLKRRHTLTPHDILLKKELDVVERTSVISDLRGFAMEQIEGKCVVLCSLHVGCSIFKTLNALHSLLTPPGLIRVGVNEVHDTVGEQQRTER
jgi:hypothetical protein